MFRMSRASLLARILFIVLRSAQHPQIPRFLQIFRGIWPMPLSLLNHPALALFAQRTRIPTSARSIGFCAIWVCISSSSSSLYTEVRVDDRRIKGDHMINHSLPIVRNSKLRKKYILYKNIPLYVRRFTVRTTLCCSGSDDHACMECPSKERLCTVQ